MSQPEYSFLITNHNGSVYRFEVETGGYHPKIVVHRYVPDEEGVLTPVNIVFFEVPVASVLRDMGQALLDVAEGAAYREARR